MKRPNRWHSFAAVISLFVCVIWHVPADAAVNPKIASLGRISEGLLAAGRLDVDIEGNLYVADGLQKKVLKYDKYGQLVKTYSGFPVYAHGLAVTPDGSKLYVAGRTVVSIVDGVSGQVLGRLTSNANPSGEGEFTYASEIDLNDRDILNGEGYIYVADMGAVKVKFYDSNGKYVGEFGGIGKLPYPSGTLGHGQFLSIWGMTVDPVAGEVYVADNQTSTYRRSTYSPQIQVFGLDGVYNRSMLQESFVSTPLAVPALGMFAGFTFDNFGRGYFLDTTWDNIRIHELPSSVLGQYGEEGYEEGQLHDPYDIIFDPLTSRLFVSSDAGRIEIYGLDGVGNPARPVTNVAPASPVLIGPGGEGEVAQNPPVLTFGNAQDDDKDVLTYDVKVLSGGVVAAEVLGVVEGSNQTVVKLLQALPENAVYSWTARSFDGQAFSDWAVEETFYLNAVAEEPTPPALLEPVASPVALNGGARFIWEGSVDPDPFDTISYLFQVAADPSFNNPLINVALNAETSVVLGELTGYADLLDGETYFWQVQAVDNHGLRSSGGEIRSFVYDTTILTIAANMPGAQVYLGGNLAYAGKYIGEAPIELRDLAPTALSVVVERAGFDPWVGQVLIAERNNTEIYAALVPAILPQDLKARPLSVGGNKLVSGADVSPFVTDFDNDGLIDLLTGEATGVLTLYRGEASDQPPAFSPGESLAVSAPAGSAPVVVDWDNDGKKDLLVGTAVGTVQCYLNHGTEAAPQFSAWSYLSVAGVPIAVGNSAVPAVFDWDGDGDKDLLVGSGAGAITAYRNIGSDAAPELVLAEQLVPALSGNAAPFVVDWNADGRKDLLVATNQHLYLYLGQAGGVFSAASVLTVSSDLIGKNGNSNNGSRYVGDRLRIFAFDSDRIKGKDLLVGNAAGEVKLARSNSNELAPAFYVALLQKVEQIRESVPAGSVAILLELDEISNALVAGDLSVVKQRCNLLQEQVANAGDLTVLLAELGSLLN